MDNREKLRKAIFIINADGIEAKSSELGVNRFSLTISFNYIDPNYGNARRNHIFDSTPYSYLDNHTEKTLAEELKKIYNTLKNGA